jgi:hypothetical protein
MKHPAQRRRRLAATLSACVAALGLIFATAAFATSDHWFTGNLQAGYGWASYNAHSISYVQGNTSANADLCVGLEDGYAGGFYDPYGSACQAYGYKAAYAYYTPTCCFHALVENGGPASPAYINNSTHYDY